MNQPSFFGSQNQPDEASRVANQTPEGLRDSDDRSRGLVTPPDSERQSGALSDDERAQLKKLNERQSEEDRKASEPTEENFTHHLHLADGRTVRSRSGAGTVYSETVRDDNGNEVEKFTPVIGAYERS